MITADISASAKFAIIQDTVRQDNNELNIKWMCDIASVSRSGYYNWVASESNRIKSEEKDQKDFLLIVEAYQHRGYSKGARGIYMRLLHQDPQIVMNIKKIRRLMNKYGLKCPIRKANPYRRAARAIAVSSVAPNLLQREFKTRGPRAVLLTDITYLFYADGNRCYLSTILDACTMQVLAFKTSQSFDVDFVLETVYMLLQDHGISLNTETLVHSDQGAHYKSILFQQLLKDSELRQSMSRKANCWDNAPQESFFGHMKDEVNIKGCTTFREVTAMIDDYVDYYNNDRYQWGLARLSPNEYYDYLITGCYPLNIPKPKGQG